MVILEKEVWIKYSSYNYNYYEQLGYSFPKYKNKQGKLKVKRGSEILVKVKDLSHGSEVILTKVCDVAGCGKTIPTKYFSISRARKNSSDGLDKCSECASRENGIRSRLANELNCVASTHPEFAKLFWDKEDTYKYTYGSGKKVDFKCPDCGWKIHKRGIIKVLNYGLSCPRCSDGISYPEKFMYNVFNQLYIDFESQKLFEWSKNISNTNKKISGKKKYDFYVPSVNMIIETHGKQHYNGGFETYGNKSLKEEQENDKLKEELALANGIKKENYIIIDCRHSEMDWIKNNILNSALIDMFDLSKVDWLKCHEFSCSTIVKEACELWNEGIKSTKKIGDILKLHESTVSKYLKQGVKIGWCDYDPSKKKSIIQLTQDGEFIKEWESASSVDVPSRCSISSVCNGKQKTAYGYKWMHKEDYEKYIEQSNMKELIHT